MVRPNSGFWEPGFWIPFLIALFYVLVIPYLLLLIDFLTDDSFKKRKIRASKRRVAELNASIDVVNAEVELEKLRTEYKDVTQLNEKIQTLNQELEKERSEAESLLNELTQTKKENIEISSKLELLETTQKVENHTDKNKSLDKAEKSRLKRRAKVELRTEINSLIKKHISEVVNFRHEDEDQLTKRILEQLDKTERTLLNLVNNYGDIVAESLKDELIEKFNLLEDNVPVFVLGIKDIRNSWDSLEDTYTNFYGPIYEGVNK
ncbi:hypothetical protein [Muricauda sp. MAR_2010_75]|uniref:hypothetical protein n=1 Tax=Allomuricauda sp. MAR_2010_75 TaxID=1250232 RepID=UPI00055A88CC|nr:hypothetical protein [Muricauda sp. MAR_2010_75]